MRALRFAPLIALILAPSGCSSSEATTNAGSADASVATDASAARDAGAATGDAGTWVRCSQPLATACDDDAAPDLCPPSLASALPGPWCSSHPRAGAILGACDGYTALVEGTGVDGTLVFLYAADAGALAAVIGISDETSVSCLGGSADVAIPLDCFATLDIDVSGPIAFAGAGAAAGCADAGAPDDGAAGSEAD